MKEKMLSTFGAIGVILYYILGIVLIAMPVIILDLSFWWTFIIFCGIEFISMIAPGLGTIANAVLYVLSFMKVIAAPIDVWSIIYFVSLGVYVLFEFIPWVMGIISAFFDR